MLKIQLVFGASLVLLIGAARAAESHPCSHTGFIPVENNELEYFACDPTLNGDYSLRRLMCQVGTVFNSDLGKCVEKINLFDGADIENPTIPPDNLDDDTTVKPETTETTRTTERPESSTTDSSTTEKSDTSTSEKPDSSTTTVSSDSTTTEKSDSTTTERPNSSTAENSETSTTAKSDAPTTEQPDSTTSKSPNSSSSTESALPTSASTSNPPESTGTTNAPGTTTEDSICAKDGFLPQEGNCAQFVVCYQQQNKWRLTTLNCPQGMQFDPRENYCSRAYDCNKSVN